MQFTSHMQRLDSLETLFSNEKLENIVLAVTCTKYYIVLDIESKV